MTVLAEELGARVVLVRNMNFAASNACTPTNFTFYVVLSQFGLQIQKTTDLGLSRRGLFKDVLGWS